MSLDIQDLTPNKVEELSTKLSNRQKDLQFMKFLKDIPMSPQENQNIIEAKLAEKQTLHKVIIDQTSQEIIGSVLFDQFHRDTMSLESYTRVDPSYKGG